ncbi:MAG: magnesium transporter CorA family protein [Flavobacteriales bacterium]|nr:MAG: magnesium transporter CorA family protein [Bacteroidota bacterium]KXK35025.1 MAG: MIT family metal ion transporter [Chlorobi bacterium OLB6]MBE2265784.1 magnesium transporter CorA family protein [Flavobacteriales bacterium]MBW7853735.1 magnesium transporter CorA family protein [Candidatus Kapabacteria bacterium]MCC6331527.1 magnesium transporter CorA family protein [Ignavibacteria bacterium]
MIFIRQLHLNECKEPNIDTVLAKPPGEYSANETVWIDMQDPTADETAMILTGWLGVHDLVVEDIAHSALSDSHGGWKMHPPKAEQFDDYLFLIYRTIELPKHLSTDSHHTLIDRLLQAQINIVLNKGVFVTIHIGSLNSVDTVRQSIDKNPQLLQRGPDFLAAMVADAAVKHLIAVHDSIISRLSELERLVLKSTAERIVLRLQRMKRHLLQYRMAIVHMNEMMQRLSRGDYKYVDIQEAAYFRDVYDNTILAEEQIELLREEIKGLIDLHFSISQSRLNEIMRRLTALGTIFLPVMTIASWYGMNFVHMPELEFWWTYPAITLFVTLTVVVLFVFFKRRGWLD